MTKPYFNRLLAIREMLNSSQPYTIQEAYDLLFDLWSEYSANIDFRDDLESIAQEHPNLAHEFTDRLNKSSRTEEKATLLKDIMFMYSPEISEEIKTPKKASEKMPDVIIPKVFISYSHKDEPFKEELITMLAGLQRRSVIDAWQDRRIEAGEEWFDVIRKAMEECSIAVLLVSPDFIASRFIQEEELVKLFRRRIREGLRVIPIIVRSSLWQSEPVIKDLQALPKDGKPVISFSQATGARDEIWTEIGQAIEKVAKRLVSRI